MGEGRRPAPPGSQGGPAACTIAALRRREVELSVGGAAEERYRLQAARLSLVACVQRGPCPRRRGPCQQSCWSLGCETPYSACTSIGSRILLRAWAHPSVAGSLALQDRPCHVADAAGFALHHMLCFSAKDAGGRAQCCVVRFEGSGGTGSAVVAATGCEAEWDVLAAMWSWDRREKRARHA